jgi:formylglycine-generating enzyme required for sulfatase activity
VWRVASTLSQYEVTQGQWVQVMGENPSYFQECGPRCPVESVSWNAVQVFLRRLEEFSGKSAFRLPTEAEWEYACRAGMDTPFSTGASLTTDQANFDGRMPYPGAEKGTFRGMPVPVGSFAPNNWGLYDMHGNVWEWTSDEYCPYAQEISVNPVGKCGSGLKNIRGGSWYFSASSARCGRRYTHDPADRGYSVGFRIVREID